MVQDTRAARHTAVQLIFPPEISCDPLVCHLVRDFDLTFNILQARITPRKEGHLTLELIGAEENVRKSVLYLKEQGVKVTGVEHHVRREDALCMHCGVCTALCPGGALQVETVSRLVNFAAEKCTACGQCVRICPVKAMRLDVAQGTL